MLQGADVSGEYSSHSPHPGPSFTREAPAHFKRGGIHYLVTSGTTEYFPNFSEFARGPGYHGPFTVLGDAHPGDASRTSYRSQISSVFKHPHKKDLYIALADRWIPQLPADMPNVYDIMAAMSRGETPPIPVDTAEASLRSISGEDNTGTADYVWLPIRFDGDRPYIEWLNEWKPDDFA
ncbi:glycoside hydrolase family protein [Nonomuraea turcica]|uniref:hypothetical protein n=1 Tax=Nonomuraea sp. G32 TaxID=3067274 RepID=UPI00273A8CB9|nr:hypothetical protein [Nonomuraea sp. G32]MDP4510214.1 hypothetical protein [Nonomuraea sp. G32]